MDQQIKTVEANIRACIGSSKGPVYMKQLTRDYNALIGGQIPYQDFNFSSLESFLQSLPSLRVCGRGGDAMVEAAVDSSSSHMLSLISKQKSSSKKPTTYFSPRTRGGFARPSRGRASSYSGPRNYSTSGNYRPPPRPYDHTSVPPRFQSKNYYTENEPTPPMKITNETRYEPRQNESTQVAPYKKVVPPRFQPKIPNQASANSSQEREPLQVQIGNDNSRHVSIVDSFDSSPVISSPVEFQSTPSQQAQNVSKIKYEEPPRLRKARTRENLPKIDVNQANEIIMKSLKISGRGTSEEDDRYNNTITSPLGPSQLIAAGLAQQQVLSPIQSEIDLLLQDTPLVETLVPYPMTHHEEVEEIMSFIPAEQNVSVPNPDEIKVEKNIELLNSYAFAMSWEAPKFKVVERKPKGIPVIQYTGIVEVFKKNEKSQKFSTFPQEHLDRDIAKGYAAKLALEELKKEEKTIVEKISSGTQTICGRVSDIVSGSCYGIFAKRVEDLYIEKFNESLPPNWIEIVEGSKSLSVERTPNSYIILPRDPSLEVTSSDALEPPELIFPSDELWDVYVTYSTATDNVWFRIYGENYSSLYEDLNSKMEKYYINEGSNELALEVKKNHYYAVLDEQSNMFLRVHVLEVRQEGQLVSAWLIDHGEIVDLPFRCFYRLLPEFYELPKQAVRCVLHGLELFAKDENAINIIYNSEDLIDKILIAQINNRTLKECVEVTFFDTSGSDDVNVNEKLLDAFLYNVKAPTISEVGGVPKEADVSFISKEGEIYLQIANPYFEFLQNMFLKISDEEISQHKLTSFSNVLVNKLYIAKYSKDGLWYRAVVTSTPSIAHNKIPVHFIDYGNAETVPICDLADASSFPPFITRLPPQAIKVGLCDLPTNALLSLEIVTLSNFLLYKTVLVKTIQKEPKVVDIFFKDEVNENVLTSVSSMITAKRAQRLESALESEGGNGLRQLEFKVGDCFPTAVIMASNPGNFIFLPLKYKDARKNLEARLHAFYEQEVFLPELSQDEIVRGNLYAAKYNKDWYRVVVTEAIMGFKALVRFLDYGHIMFVKVSDLRLLKPEFCTDPFYAVKGKLAGVKPKHSDWSVDDCLRFQQLVVEEALYASVVSVDNNLLDPLEMTVSILLIDTTSAVDVDVYIADVLVNEKRAVKVSS